MGGLDFSPIIVFLLLEFGARFIAEAIYSLAY